jgi:hypothetical protein
MKGGFNPPLGMHIGWAIVCLFEQELVELVCFIESCAAAAVITGPKSGFLFSCV